MSIICLDIDGYPLSNFYQWDNNQKIVIEGATLSPVPSVHFANPKHRTALVVAPIVSEESLIVDVPNLLLQQAETLTVYIYEENGEDGHRTRHTILIPVIPRPKPDDYEYEGNVEFTKVPDGLLYQNSRLYLLSKGEIVSDPVIISGGGGGSYAASDIIIVDDGDYYISEDVEGALQEVGNALEDKQDKLTPSVSDDGKIVEVIDGSIGFGHSIITSIDGSSVVHSNNNIPTERAVFNFVRSQIIYDADGMSIADSGGYYLSTNIEGALQELGAELSGINTLLGSGVVQ